MTIKIKRTERGFAIGTFADEYGAECSIQKSSLATKDCIWLGQGKDRMHLSQNHVKQLLPLLNLFAETGELE